MLYAISEYVDAARRRGAVHGVGPLPHRRRPHDHRRRALDRDDARGRHRRDRRHARDRARRDPRRRPRDRGRDGRPQARGLLLVRRPRAGRRAGRLAGRQGPPAAAPHRHRRVRRRRQVDADRPAALRLQGDPRRPARAHRRRLSAAAATARSTSRCSPTACAPSASRASRSTSPTATSRRRGARSSSPTRPGHVQYTRNMVTGASTADVAIVLVDARQGCRPSSRAATPRSPACSASRLVFAVNKMDLVDWDEDVFRRIGGDFRAWAARLDVADSPSSRSPRCTATTSSSARARSPGTAARRCCGTSSTCTSRDRTCATCRFPVQWVIRPQTRAPDYRGYAGQVAGGVLKAGDEVLVLPAGRATRIVARSTARRRSTRRRADVGDRAPRGRPRRRARRR